MGLEPIISVAPVTWHAIGAAGVVGLRPSWSEILINCSSQRCAVDGIPVLPPPSIFFKGQAEKFLTGSFFLDRHERTDKIFDGRAEKFCTDRFYWMGMDGWTNFF